MNQTLSNVIACILLETSYSSDKPDEGMVNDYLTLLGEFEGVELTDRGEID